MTKMATTTMNYYLESGEKRSFEDAGGSGPFAILEKLSDDF